MTTGNPPVRIVICPSCKGPSRYAADNAYRPFCCERCRNFDLGAWANEQFRVGVEPPGDEADEPEEAGGSLSPPH